MNRKKLILLVISAFSLSTYSLFAPETVAQSETPESSLEALPAELISACQEVQRECSKQVDFLTAILQQIMGGIQKGSIKTSMSKAELTQKVYSYIRFMHILQGQSVKTAEPETLMRVTIILKNVIDRLTIALDSQLTTLEIPDINDLLIPDKNFDGSLEYLLKVLVKNSERLDTLSAKSTSLGLTATNKAFRAFDNFYQNYKWPILLAGLAGASFALYQWQKMPLTQDAASPTNKDWLKDTYNALNANIYPGAIMASIAVSSTHQKLGKIGDLLIDNVFFWTYKKYKKAQEFCADSYDRLKGVKNIKRELATTLDNEPTLDDESLIGLEDQKRELNAILALLEDPELYIRAGIEFDKCLLFAGPSRTGKTALVKALAATINEKYSKMGMDEKVKFMDITSLLLNPIKGATLNEAIGYAIATAPCILFIDEIHLLGLQKNGNRELLNDFLTQLTELHKIKDPRKQVFIIAATNHPELLAPELFKHERFAKVIRFKKPGITERANFFTSCFQKYGINPEVIDLKSIVLQTKDCDFGHLQQIIKEARFEARAKGQGVSQEHLQRAINSIVHGVASAMELRPEEAQIAAIDQAGKIVTHYKLDIHETIHLATISKVDGKIEEDNYWLSDKKDTEVAPIRYGTIISSSNREEIPFSDALELEKLCKRYLSGLAAQKLLLGTYYIDYTAQDYKAAFEIAQKIVLKGLTLKMLPPEQQDRIFQEAQRLLELYEADVHIILQNNKSLLEKLVAELIKERCITGKDIQNIVQ
jgi:ATP-dependent Zn protease